MQITIHRGINQIGGCITEISTQQARIFVDMGDNLPGNGPVLSYEEKEALVSGLFSQNKRSHEAVFYTHTHPDHVGMLSFVSQIEGVRQYMSQGTRDVLLLLEQVLLERQKLMGISEEDADTRIADLERCIPWPRPRRRRRPKPILVGDIKVTPFFVSHSTYDAQMLLIEADGKRILHTGDYRGHGYLSKGLLPTLRTYVKQVDYLITEGTMLGLDDACETEEEISRRMASVMQAFKYVFVLASATDIERLAAINQASLASHRQLMACSLMHYKMMDYFTRQAESSLFRFNYQRFSPRYAHPAQIERMRRDGFAMVVSAKHSERVRQIMSHFDPAQTLLIYSSWDGYYKLPEQVEVMPEYKQMRDLFPNVVDLHTSGHASPSTIAEVIRTVNPRDGIIAIHKSPGTTLSTLPLPDSLSAKIIPDRKQTSEVVIK